MMSEMKYMLNADELEMVTGGAGPLVETEPLTETGFCGIPRGGRVNVIEEPVGIPRGGKIIVR